MVVPSDLGDQIQRRLLSTSVGSLAGFMAASLGFGKFLIRSSFNFQWSVFGDRVSLLLSSLFSWKSKEVLDLCDLPW